MNINFIFLFLIFFLVLYIVQKTLRRSPLSVTLQKIRHTASLLPSPPFSVLDPQVPEFIICFCSDFCVVVVDFYLCFEVKFYIW